jgi:hypothetical protein
VDINQQQHAACIHRCCKKFMLTRHPVFFRQPLSTSARGCCTGHRTRALCHGASYCLMVALWFGYRSKYMYAAWYRKCSLLPVHPWYLKACHGSAKLRSCSGSKYPGKGPVNHSGCNYGTGGGSDCYGDSGFVRDHIGFLPFPSGYSGSAPLTTLPRLDPSRIIFAPDAGDPSEKWGTQDPQVAYDPHSQQYFLSYTAWAGPSAGWGQKAAVSKHPADKDSWRRLGPTFTPNNSWPVTPKGVESNIKCSALYANPDPKATPRYYLYSVSTVAARPAVA